MNADAIGQILSMVSQFGWAAVFLYLYVNEKKSHEETRRLYRDDLRDMAGLAPRFTTWQQPGQMPRPEPQRERDQ